jgi:PAS domain S-box-containing protein
MRDTPFLLPDGISSLRSPDLYRVAFENATDAFFLLEETRILDGNEAFLRLLGYENQMSLESMSLAAISAPMQADGVESNIKAAEMIVHVSQNQRHPFDWVFRRADGEDVAVTVILTPLEISEKQVLFGVVHQYLSDEGTERKLLEDAFRDMARGVSSTTGDTFFRSLVEYLSRALKADYAFIGELSGENQTCISTTAVCVDGEIVPNFEYSLLHTPCANIISAINGSDVCAYPTGVQTLFPQDKVLVEMGVDGYVGTSLFDSSGRILGLMVVLFREPIRSLSVVESMLQVFAARAAAELERGITERSREQALAALTETEERFKSAFERSAIGMAIVGLDDRYLQTNQALCEMLGYSAEEMTRLTTSNISHPDDLSRLGKTHEKRDHLHSGEIRSFQVEKRYRHKQGHYFWATVGVSMVRDVEGNLLHYITQVQDISERKRAEAERTVAIEELRRVNEQLEARVQQRTAELERDRALLEAVLRQMPAGVMVAEAPSGKLLLGNEQMSRILRGAVSSLSCIEDLSHIGMMRADGSFYSPEEIPITRALRNGEVVQNEEVTILRGDGTRGVLLSAAAPIQDESGRIIAAVGTEQDITNRKQMEEALRRLHNELEMQVQERTAELERANIALQNEVQERKRAEQVSRGQTQALASTLNSLTSQPDLDTFMSYLMKAISNTLEADSLGIELYDAKQDRTMPRNSYAGDQVLTTEMLQELGIAPSQPAADDVTWQAVLADPRPFGIYNMENDPRLIYRQVFWDFGVRSVLVVPMLLGEKPVGYLFICHQQPRHYGAEEMELAQALTQQVVLALQLESLALQGEEAAVLAERNRLAREIHDTLAQGFAGILIHLQLAEVAMTRKPDRAMPALIQARDLAKSSLAEARRSVLALRPTVLQNASLLEAIRRMTDSMTAGTELRSRIEVLGAPCPLPSDIEDHLLRVCQESLNNTLKYAEASEVSVTLSFAESGVSLMIRDDGVGFTLGERPRGGGFGLVGMRERLEAMRGQLTIHSQPGQGTEIIAVVPVSCHTERSL